MFAEDLSQFFSTADFAVAAVFTRAAATVATCNVIFDSPTQPIGLYDQELEEPTPRVKARTADIAAVKRGDTCTVSAVACRVERIEHDGTGVSTIFLAKP